MYRVPMIPQHMSPSRLILVLLLCLLCPFHVAAGGHRLRTAGYVFHEVVVPFAGASNPAVTGEDLGGTLVATYVDAAGNPESSVQHRRHAGLVAFPLLGEVAQDIHAGRVVGYKFFPEGILGTFYYDGTEVRLSVPQDGPGDRTPVTEARAIRGNVIVGDYRRIDTGRFEGFVYDILTGTYTPIAVPDSLSTLLTGLLDANTLIGTFADASGVNRPFRWDSGTVTPLDIPEAQEVELVGVTPDGTYGCNTGTAGCIFDGTTVRLIQFPGAILTELFGMLDDETVYGRYLDGDGVQHAFTATPGHGHGVGRVASSVSPFEVHMCGAGSKRRLCVEARHGKE